MVKLPDNELLSMWKTAKSREDNSYNDSFSYNYFSRTNILELKHATVVSSRRLSSEEYITMTYKNLKEKNYSHILYCLVVVNVDNDYPPEKSRICSYCSISDEMFDFVNTIVTYKTNQMLNLLNKAIDEKFTYLMNHNFNVLRYRIGKSEVQNILVKPDRVGFNIPSLSSIMSNMSNMSGDNEDVHVSHVLQDSDILHASPRPLHISHVSRDALRESSESYYVPRESHVSHTSRESYYPYHGVTIVKNTVKNPVIDSSKLFADSVVQRIPPEILVPNDMVASGDSGRLDPFMVSEISERLEDTKISSLLDSVSTNIHPKQKRSKQFTF